MLEQGQKNDSDDKGWFSVIWTSSCKPIKILNLSGVLSV